MVQLPWLGGNGTVDFVHCQLTSMGLKLTSVDVQLTSMGVLQLTVMGVQSTSCLQLTCLWIVVYRMRL